VIAQVTLTVNVILTYTIHLSEPDTIITISLLCRQACQLAVLSLMEYGNLIDEYTVGKFSIH